MSVLRVLLLFFALSFCQSNGSNMPAGNYFANAYSKNIEPVAQLVASIMKSEDLGTSQTNLFLSETALTATDLPTEAEGSGQKPEMRAYIPLTEFRKLAASYLQTLKKQQVAGKARTELKERLRDLRMENVHRKYAMAKYFEGIDGSDLAKQYNTFSEKMFELEKYLLEFFTSNSDEIKVWNFHLTTPQELLENLSSLAEKDNVFDQLLKKNSHSDKVFITMYQTLRNNAIFLTVSWTAYEISNDRSLLNDTKKFDELVANVTKGYETVLNSLKGANDRRDEDGFIFEELFTAAQLSSLTDKSTLPHPDRQNLFSFNENTEDFEQKYVFITTRYCGDGIHFATNGHSYVNKTTCFQGCCATVFRHPLSSAPANGSLVAQKLRSAALTVLKTRYNHGTTNTAELIGDELNSWDELGLIVIFTGKELADDLYNDPHTYKVALHLHAFSERPRYADSYYRNDLVNEEFNLQITGYFLKPKDATY